MSDNVENLTIEILRSIQATISQFRDETGVRFEQLEARLDRLDTGMRKDRRNAAGMLVMVRATAGDFDARVNEVEERVATLEARA